MSKKVLVTGFEAFGRAKRPNPSSQIVLPAVKAKYGDLVETLILPVAHDTAAHELTEAITDLSPAAVVMFGVAAYGRKVRLEQRAINLRSSLFQGDNYGQRKLGPIAVGPMVRKSTLPLQEIYAGLQAHEIPVKLSSSAGSYICNEVMYRGLEHTAAIAETGQVIPTGFVHVGPGLDEPLVEQAAIQVIGVLNKKYA